MRRLFYLVVFALAGLLFLLPKNSADAQTYRILPLGNSITQADISKNGANSYRRNLWNKLQNAGYPVDFVGSLDTDRNGLPFPDPNFDHDHEGHWGWRADQIVAGLPGWLAGYTPDVALIHLGTNDLVQDNTIESTISEIEAIIDILRDDNPVITVFLAQIIPIAASFDLDDSIDALNIEIAEFANRKDHVYSRVIAVDHNSGFSLSYLSDGVHPNQVGEEFMAQRWFEAFDDLYAVSIHTITASAGTGGSIEPSGAVSVTSGQDQSFTITPEEGYEVEDVLVDGSSAGAVARYTFTDVQSDHTISSSFKLRTYTITASTGTGGSIEPSGAVSVTSGQDQSFTITPEEGYVVEDVLVDGESAGTVTEYTFTDVQSDHTISSSFTLRTLTITASAGTGGSMEPSGDISVLYGQDQSFTITPEEGYVVEDVLVDGASAGAVNEYTFTDVRSDHTISAAFKPLTHTITAIAGSGGSIEPSGAVIVVHGQDQSFNISPQEGYEIVVVMVDGEAIGTVTDYLFTDVQEDHSISASFKLITNVDVADAEKPVVYPSPSSGKIYINLREIPDRKDVIKIVDFSGRTLLVLDNLPGNQEFEIDLNTVGTGIYMLQFFRSGSLQSWTKFLVAY
jgi:lysophospholipase L1-like esterase